MFVCKDSSDSDHRSSVRGAAAGARRPRSHGVSTQNGSGAVLGFSAFRRATRLRQRKRMTKEEYHRLKHMVPSVSSQSRVSKVQVIEEAIKYIDSLHVALFQRLKAQEEIGTASATSASPTAAASSADAAHGGRSEGTLNNTECDPILLRQWIERVLPVPTSAAMKLFQERQNGQQRRERCRELPSFLDRVNRMAKKRHN